METVEMDQARRLRPWLRRDYRGTFYLMVKTPGSRSPRRIYLGTKSQQEAEQIIACGDIDQISAQAAERIDANIKARTSKASALRAAVYRTTTRAVPDDKANRSFADVIEAYREICIMRGRTGGSVEVLKAALANMGISLNATLAEIPVTALRKLLYDQRLRTSTRRSYWYYLNAFFDWCIGIGWLRSNPAKLVAVPRKDIIAEKRYVASPVTEDEYRLLIEKARELGKPQHRIAIMLSFRTGLRLKDCASLRWDSISGNRLTLIQAKTARLLDTTIPDDVMAEIETMRGLHPVYVLPSLAEVASSPTDEVSDQMKRIFLRCGIQGKTFRDLRHSFGTEHNLKVKQRLIEQLVAEVALLQTAKALGHTSTGVTATYVHDKEGGKDER